MGIVKDMLIGPASFMIFPVVITNKFIYITKDTFQQTAKNKSAVELYHVSPVKMSVLHVKYAQFHQQPAI